MKNKPLYVSELILSVGYYVPGTVLGCRATRQTLPQSLCYFWENRLKRIFKEGKISKYLTEIIIIVTNDHTFYEGKQQGPEMKVNGYRRGDILAETQRVGKSFSLSKGAEREASSEGEPCSKEPRREKVQGCSSNKKVTSMAGVLRLRDSGQQWWGSVAHGKILRGNIRKAH